MERSQLNQALLVRAASKSVPLTSAQMVLHASAVLLGDSPMFLCPHVSPAALKARLLSATMAPGAQTVRRVCLLTSPERHVTRASLTNFRSTEQAASSVQPDNSQRWIRVGASAAAQVDTRLSKLVGSASSARQGNRQTPMRMRVSSVVVAM